MILKCEDQAEVDKKNWARWGFVGGGGELVGGGGLPVGPGINPRSVL